MKKISKKQMRWAEEKAKWERTTVEDVLESYTPLPSNHLTPCGVYACYGCPICKEVKSKKR